MSLNALLKYIIKGKHYSNHFIKIFKELLIIILMRFLLRPNIIKRAFSHHPMTTKLPDFVYDDKNINRSENINVSKNVNCDTEILNNTLKILTEKVDYMQDELRKSNRLTTIHFFTIHSVYLTVFLFIV